jgi:translation initiation factor IF-1
VAAKGENVESEGEVTGALRGSLFRNRLDNGHETLDHLFARSNRFRIRVTLGDRGGSSCPRMT